MTLNLCMHMRVHNANSNCTVYIHLYSRAIPEKLSMINISLRMPTSKSKFVLFPLKHKILVCHLYKSALKYFLDQFMKKLKMLISKENLIIRKI